MKNCKEEVKLSTDKMPFQIPGCISKITSMSRGIMRIQFDTQENISGDAMKRLFDMLEQLGWMTINVRQIEAQEIVDLPPLRPMDTKKTPAQRLRSVLYRIWENDNNQFDVFDNYYIYVMERLIEHYKKQLS